MDNNEEDVRHFKEIYKRKPCFTKSIAHYHAYPNYASGDPYSRCEHSMNHNVNQMNSYGRKKKSKMHRCPSCHCQLNFKRTSSKKRDIDNIEAIFKKTEHIFDNALTNGGVKKSYSIPLSPKLDPRCHRTHYSKKTSNNYHRQKEHRNEEEDEKFTTIIDDIINKGVENECYNKYPNLPLINMSKDCHCKNNQFLQDIQDYSELDSNFFDKCCEKYHRSKRCDSSMGEFESNLKKKESDLEYRQYLKQQYHELDQLKYTSHICEKLKNIDDQQCKEDDLSNVEQTERKKKSNFPEDETRRKKKEHHFNNELQCIDAKSSKGPQVSMSNNKNVPEQRNDKTVQQIEVSTSYHSINGETDGDVDDFLEDEKLCRELKNISYLKPCRISTTVKNKKVTKSFEGTTCDGKEINEKIENSDVVEKSDQLEEDLDLHASKSHILNLIDKALSKEFGPLDVKKRDPVKEEITRQELCIEISRALQSDNYDSLAQMLLSNRGTPDYVRHLKILRWEYLNHIQDKLRKLYDLEKILDDCSSPRNSLLTLQSHTNTTDQYKHART
ncbi:uncharacterized protein LOC118440504 [Vespa mandarinia]|uniref:uncharacterized protein LOC118440504 n=1 Tax=Vespa mandarinia TaxID=7446 RepID=UPI00161C89DA|nr:uncharacterized protein LOC118440504 [Vespa mandarinia]